MLKMERKKKQTNLEEPYKPGVIFKTCNMWNLGARFNEET